MNNDMEAMFNSIAPNYDRINKITSFGLDDYWRGRLVKSLKKTDAQKVLDVACGTGVLSWMIYRKLHIEVTALDLSAQMLKEAQKKRGDYSIQNRNVPLFIKGSAEQLPFAGQSFDAVTIAFGARNFEDRTLAFRQIHRVLRPGGHLFILDFASPLNPIWNFFFRAYFWHIVPLWGQALSGNRKAYRYLPSSVRVFPQYESLCRELSNAGFSCLHFTPFTGGVVILYSGMRPSV